MNKKNKIDNLQIFEDFLLSFWSLKPYQDIISWAINNIDFSDDISAERTKLDLSLTPHLVEPLQQWEFDGLIREVQVIGIEQHGKTLLEVIGALYSMIFKPSSMLVVYPSDDLAYDINKSKYEPLISKIEGLAKELEKPFCRRQDRYCLSNSTMYFQGAGRKIISKSCKIRIADELSAWGSIGGIDNFEDLKKRGRSYSESLLYSVTTVRYDNDKSWQNFLNGSQGYWTLQCQHCGKHTIRSCDLHHLQFDSTFDDATKTYIVDASSIRLICPDCHYEHVESQKELMNQQGKYIHQFPERLKEKPSYQFGVLCSLFPFMSWSRIAEKILDSGKSSSKEALEEYDNSWRGLPYKQRQHIKDDNVIRKHFFEKKLTKNDIEFLYVVADTQDTFNPAGLFAVDKMDNLYLLDYHNFEHMYLDEDERNKIDTLNKSKGLPPVVTLEDYINTPYDGLQPLFCVIDRQGHRSDDVDLFGKRNAKVIKYQGTSLKFDKFKKSDKMPKMVLVSARDYQADLIFYLYNQNNKLSNYLYITPNLKEETIKEITCVQPDNSVKNGNDPRNWQPMHDAVHDAFDVLKMAYFSKDYAIKNFEQKRFQFCESPSLKKRFANKIKMQDDKPVDKPKPNVKSSWISNY